MRKERDNIITIFFRAFPHTIGVGPGFHYSLFPKALQESLKILPFGKVGAPLAYSDGKELKQAVQSLTRTPFWGDAADRGALL